jgi:hypothetical protein
MPSEKLDAIRARWAISRLSLDASEMTQARQDIRDLLEMVKQAEDLLDALYDREHAPSDPRGPIRYLGQDVWVDDATTAASALEEVRSVLAKALGWEPST